MATLKMQTKTGPVAGSDPIRSHIRRQTTWIRSEEKLKNWRKATTTKNSSSVQHLERKSDTTRSGRSSDYNSQSTSSSSEPTNIKRLQDCEDIEERETIEKCLKWMETLPTKFSGMHIFVQPSEVENSWKIVQVTRQRYSNVPKLQWILRMLHNGAMWSAHET